LFDWDNEPACWIGIYGVLIGMLIGGVERKVLAHKSRPNEGIRISLRMALVSGVALLLMGLLPIFWDESRDFGIVNIWRAFSLVWDDFRFGILIGIFVALTFGGQAVLRHYILRLMLALAGVMPLRLIRFLEDARSLIFLQRAGGSYLFIHRLLLDHFANRD
jgi:hypothetical protein